MRQAAVVLDIAERQLIGVATKFPAMCIRAFVAIAPSSQACASSRMRRKVQQGVRSEANEYLKEMISIPTRFWLDVWAKLCEVCLGLGYDKALQYDPADLERVRKIVRQYPSALLWTHKTYIDGFVVPKILFDNNFPMPHFFGGANLNIPFWGSSSGGPAAFSFAAAFRTTRSTNLASSNTSAI